ncbi:MAG: hypothetical protein SOR89_00600 [Ndongobacter sp.]|nr:hypothetical protein [Ndongobacter sp.]
MGAALVTVLFSFPVSAGSAESEEVESVQAEESLGESAQDREQGGVPSEESETSAEKSPKAPAGHAWTGLQKIDGKMYRLNHNGCANTVGVV